MRSAFVVSLCLLVAHVASAQGRSLADLLQRYGIPLPSDQRIRLNDVPSNDTPLNTDAEFAFAYRLTTLEGGLSGPVQFIRYDKRRMQWTQVTIAGSKFNFQQRLEVPCEGMVGEVEHQLDSYFIGMEISPSAECTLVLREDSHGAIGLESVLDGWVAVYLKPSTVIYSGSMVHFADVHPETLWMYDLQSKKVTLLYPQPHDPFRDDFSTKLEQVIDQKRCRTNNWACEPDRFSSVVEKPVVSDETHCLAFHVNFETEGFLDPDEADKLEQFQGQEYAYFFQLQPFRWREFRVNDLKSKFRTDVLQQLISPKMIEKVFATPAPN
jgi:hypothetical protein